MQINSNKIMSKIMWADGTGKTQFNKKLVK